MTFFRQVGALVTYPELLNSKEFPEDAKCRAKDFLKANRGSIGSSVHLCVFLIKTKPCKTYSIR